jgi:ParB family chromosome partitioning protein
MARRRQLKAPSPEALQEISDGIDREIARTGLRPPIADVVADAALHSDPLPQADREVIARDRADAQRLRDAEGKGLVAVEIPLEDILAEAMTRDRLKLDEDEMQELMSSISLNGLRLPVEVHRSVNPEAGKGYNLISGFRRLTAMRRLHAANPEAGHGTIAAFIRQPETAVAPLVAMIEENEIRSGLSQYERGRAAAMAVYDGIFGSIDEAVSVLFQTASKAKRSKIRSFALIHEELGDMLQFATSLNERQCLKIAAALRAGHTEELRSGLEEASPKSASDEWNVILPVLELSEKAPVDPSRGGRPKADRSVHKSGRIDLGNGLALERESGPSGFAIRFHGDRVSGELVDEAIEKLRALLADQN